jgi:hypothetical protein
MSVSLRYQSIVFVQVITACAFAASAAAQDPKLPHLPAPPPMHLVSKSDRTELDEARDPKSRLRASMTIAELHLTRAEKLTEDKKFDEALAELGGYLGLIGDLRDYVSTLDPNKGNTRDLYRHFEWQVRTHIPRLAIIQRTTPASYLRNIRDAEDFIKETRAEALDSFYGHSVLREPPPPEKNLSPMSGGVKSSPEKSLAPASNGAKDPAQPKRP